MSSAPRKQQLPAIHPATLGLIALLIAAFALRVYQLSWDEGRILHPDELHVIEVTATRISFEWPPDLSNLLDPARSRLNPRSDDPVTGRPRQYAYGALPVLVTDFVATLLKAITGTDWTSYFDRLYKIGRVLSSTFDTATVLVIYVLGRRLYNRRVGLFGATLYALAPMSIQLSHFFTTDSWLTFFVALTLLLCVRAYDRPTFSRFGCAGFGGGLALATKGSVVPLLVVVGLAALLTGWRTWQRGESGDESLWLIVSRTSIAGIAAIVGFGLFEPYAIARPMVYLDQLRVQSGIVRGSLDATYTRQYVGTVPFAYQFEQAFRWGVGPVTTVLMTLGVIAFLLKLRHCHDHALFITGSWILLQGLVVILPETKFLRYLSPLLPALAILGGAFIDTMHGRLKQRSGSRWALGAVSLLIAGVFIWTAGFTSVYAAPNTRLEASRWIYAHVPNGSTIGVETWDDSLPVPFGVGLTPWDFQYESVPFDLYGDRPTQTVADDLYASLDSSDYVVLASNRVQRGVSALPWRYPVQIRYYDLLTSGQLGFQPVAEFKRFPGIGSVRLDDQTADESFINYDHPRVQIFQKTSLVPRETYDLLMAHAVATTIHTSRADTTTLLLDEPVSDLPNVNDSRWSASITRNSAAALIVWIALLLLLQFAGLPLARLAFGRFPDGGWTFSRLIALLVTGYVVWIGSSLQILSFRAIWCWCALLLLLGFWIAYRRRQQSALPRRSVFQWKATLSGEAVFWFVFVLFLVFRLINPDSWHPFWGGEKPMEFAHINAILRSAHFPPYDPWFADGYINYYYFGLYLVAFCIKLTGIPSEIAFNLAQPTVIALLASAGFGTCSAIARRIVNKPTVALFGGLAGSVLLVAIGNLEAFVQVARAYPARYEPGFALTWGASRVIPFTINEFPFFTGLYADLHAHVVALPITMLVIALCFSIAGEPRLTIVAMSSSHSSQASRRTLGIRFGLLIITLGALFPTNAWDVPVYAALSAVSIFMATACWKGLAFRFALSGLLLAVVGAASYLMYLPFHQHYVALFGSVERVRSTTDLWPFLDHLGGLLIIACFGLTVLLLDLGRTRIMHQPWIFAPAVALLTMLFATGVTYEPSTDLVKTLSIVIVVLAATQLFLISQLGPDRLARNVQFWDVIVLTGVIGFAIALVLDRLPLALMCAVTTTAIVLWLRGSTTGSRFIGSLTAAAASVAGGVEVIFLADDLVTIDWYRMNTVFKFYNQVWVLLAVVGGVSIAVMLDRATQPILRFDPRSGPGFKTETSIDDTDHPRSEKESALRPLMHSGSAFNALRTWSAIGLVASGLVILTSVAYPFLATKPRLDLRFAVHPSIGTLNALAWMDDGTIPLIGGESLQFADDHAAIDWLNDNIGGSPVIAEASIGPYRCNGSRISINTGLPTIIGWERHETQQRYPEGLSERVDDVRDLYADPDVKRKREIISRYDVRYIIVGQLERTYPQIAGNECRPTKLEDGIAAFETMVGTSLEVAFRNRTTTIYRVLPIAPESVGNGLTGV